jgi:phospholipase C
MYNGTPAISMGGFLADYASVKGVANSLVQTPNIMNCFRPADVPVISELAYWYAACDHWYASVPSQTFTNRSFAHAGTASGYVDNVIGKHAWDIWSNNTQTVFNVMEQHSPGSWRVYFGGEPLLCNVWTSQGQVNQYGPFGDNPTQRMFPMPQFYTDLKNYQSDPTQYPFPSYVFIEPNFLSGKTYGVENDEHPNTIDLDGTSNVLWGEQLLADVFNALTASGLWSSTLFVVVFDEHGGTYDHFAPVPATAPRPDDVVIAQGQPGYSGFLFDRYGVRVPAVVMSPWIPKSSVFNAVYDHTSIIRTVCEAFLPAGTSLLARDAVAQSLAPLPARRSSRATQLRRASRRS